MFALVNVKSIDNIHIYVRYAFDIICMHSTCTCTCTLHIHVLYYNAYIYIYTYVSGKTFCIVCTYIQYTLGSSADLSSPFEVTMPFYISPNLFA